MPSSQSEYPLTLAEVLFEELETTHPDIEETLAKLDKLDKEKHHGDDVTHGEPTWNELEEQIEVIRALPTYGRKKIEQIWKEEEIKGNAADEDLSDLIWKCKKELSKDLVPKLYAVTRRLRPRLSALCLSGGGVRSAVFNLGILQGLARCGLLDKFDYLSTVSGGGFIGSWLSAWIHREGKAIGKVSQWLADPPTDPLKPEPDPLYKLRIYANYLTPKKGLLSVDTWTLIAVYLRNLILNWLVFIPVIVAFLILPRIWLTFVKSPYGSSNLCLRIGFVGAAVALIFIGLNLPGAKRLNK